MSHARLLPALAASVAAPAALAMALLGGCSSDPAPPTCFDAVCEPGEARCVGNYTWACAADGLRWTISSCGEGLYCDAGVCQPRKCTNLASGACADQSTVLTCSARGDAQGEETCKTSESCVGGACVPNGCEDGATRCGEPHTKLLCQGGLWTAQACAPQELCKEEGGQASCVPEVCTPEAARCDGDTAYLCDELGASETATPCAANETCLDGFCIKALCADDDTDATASGDTGAEDVATDAGPTEDAKKDTFIPPLQPIRKVEFILNGQKKTFDLAARANYIAADKNLKISAGGGTPPGNIEINIAPLEPYTVGAWNESDGSEVGVVICYYDGVHPADEPVAPCQVGFNWASIAYNLDLKDNGEAGVNGTFTATLKNASDEQIEMTDGTFSVVLK